MMSPETPIHLRLLALQIHAGHLARVLTSRLRQGRFVEAGAEQNRGPRSRKRHGPRSSVAPRRLFVVAQFLL